MKLEDNLDINNNEDYQENKEFIEWAKKQLNKILTD